MAPAIAPGCTVLVRPIFAETIEPGQTPSASAEVLAAAIVECVDAGAHLLNLSVGLLSTSTTDAARLRQALDHAAHRGVLVVAAAGNQGTLGSTAITEHPWVIPVVGCDHAGRPIAISNLGHSIARRGLGGPGQGVTSLGSDGRPSVSAGTSVAVPFITGALALAWSEAPRATASQVKLAAIHGNRSRPRGMVPPPLDAWGIHSRLQRALDTTGTHRSMERIETNTPEMTPTPAGAGVPASPTLALDHAVVPQHGDGGCSCGGASAAPAAAPMHVYAIGRIRTRFPSLAVEKEFLQVVGRDDVAGLTDGQVAHAVLSRRENRYLARKICWVLSIEGLETYLVHPRDPADLDLLIEALREGPRPTDVDVVIGRRGPIASPEVCNGLQVPLLGLEQLYSFDVDGIVASIPRPDGVPAESFGSAAEELFLRIMQMADNAGATDEHRALNYLAVRYPAIYSTAANAFARNEALRSVDVRPSRLAGVRKVVDVVFSFVNRATDVSDKYFVRVDVTEAFPFLVTKISPFYDR